MGAAPKKGQTMPVIKGFALLVLPLPATAESSPRFIQKGTLTVPTIWGFDLLVLPRSTLDAALLGPIIISPKMFSLAPNLQTQEGVIIHMPKPFPYKDSHRVLWKYDAALISNWTSKEEVCSNVSLSLSKLTRNGRCYTPEKLKKWRKEIGKGIAEPVRNSVTTEEAEEFLKTIRRPIIVWFSSWTNRQLRFLSWHCCYLSRSTMRLFWRYWRKCMFLLVLHIPLSGVWYHWCWTPTRCPF